MGTLVTEAEATAAIHYAQQDVLTDHACLAFSVDANRKHLTTHDSWIVAPRDSSTLFHLVSQMLAQP